MSFQFDTRAYANGSVTAAKMASDTITNTQIKSDAAIAMSKLAAVTASKALVSDGSGFISASAITATELGYLSGVSSAIQTQINALESGYSRRKAVIDYVVDNTAAPASEVSGDRYLLSVDGGAPHADYDGASAGDIVEFNGSVWVATSPLEGYVVYDDDSNYDYLYVNDGTPAWEPRAVISTALADGKMWIGNGSGVATPVTMSGDVTISNAGVAAIASDVIVNADIKSDAAIALSKLAAGTDGYIIVGAETTGVPTYVAMSGDITISNAGVAAIASGVIVNADIKSDAAIALSKLASGTDAQMIVANVSGVPAYVSLTGDVTVSNAGVTAIASGVIVNADIKSDAAIAVSKLESITAAYILLGPNGNGAPVAVAVSGDITIGDTGVTAIGSGKVTNDMLAGSIADTKLSTISTANKVSGSAVQLNAAGGLEDSTGLQINVDATNSTTKINASNELEGLKAGQEDKTLAGGDITAQYIDLAKLIHPSSLKVVIQGLPSPIIGVHLTTSTEGGVTRVTFADALATAGAAALVAGDVMQLSYQYLS